MEKISKIIAPSARTKTYDVTRAQPARPGASQLGRPQSMDVIQDRVTLSEKFIEPIMNGDALPVTKTSVSDTYKPRDASAGKSAIIKDLTNKFFASKQNPMDMSRETDQVKSEEVVAQVQSAAGSSVKPDSSKDTNL